MHIHSVHYGSIYTILTKKMHTHFVHYISIYTILTNKCTYILCIEVQSTQF